MFKEEIDYYHGYILPLQNRRQSVTESLAMVRGIAVSFLKDLIKATISRRRSPKVPDFSGKKIVAANTANNYEALKFLLKKYPDSLLITSGTYAIRHTNAVNVRPHLDSSSDFVKYLFIFYLVFHPKYRTRNYPMIIRTFGFIDSYRRMFKNNRPVCVFVSNDHYPDARALILATRKMKIRCFYLQHASVSSLFPPMVASHALLYGAYSEEIYRKIPGTDSTIISVGNHKFDAYKDLILQKQPSMKVGIAFNKLDKVSDVVELCDFLALTLRKENIILRPHPADKRPIPPGYATSPPITETSLDFLTKIDVLVAGNSSILLEAAAMNVHPLQFSFGKVLSHFVDYYGFIREGVAKEVGTKEELVAEISTKLQMRRFDSRKRTKVYDISVGEPYEFDVENHIISVVNKILGP